MSEPKNALVPSQTISIAAELVAVQLPLKITLPVLATPYQVVALNPEANEYALVKIAINEVLYVGTKEACENACTDTPPF